MSVFSQTDNTGGKEASFCFFVIGVGQFEHECADVTGKFAEKHGDDGNDECGNNDDEINFEIEIDEDANDISLKQWTVQKTDWWTEFVKPRYDIDNEYLQGLHWLWTGFINGLATRLRLTKNIWWDGYVKYESITVLSKQQALNYADALKKGVLELEQSRKSKKTTTP